MSSSGDRRLALLARMLGEDGTLETSRLCELCAEVTGMSGAGIMLMSGHVTRGSVCATDEVSARIEQLQFELGEGPCVDAFNLDQPVLEPDLAHPAEVRWPAFAGPAVAAGACAVFGFPVQVGAARLGALNLYRSEPGPLSDQQHADALLLSSMVAEALLLLQSDAPPGSIAVELEAHADFQYVVHQASGMVAAQLEADLGEALVRLRAHAFGSGRSLTDVARDVVARRLRFGVERQET